MEIWPNRSVHLTPAPPIYIWSDGQRVRRMMSLLRRMILALSLLALGGGYAACAVAAVVPAVSIAETADPAVDCPLHQPPIAEVADTSNSDEVPPQGHDCDHCGLVAVSADAPQKSVGASALSCIAVLQPQDSASYQPPAEQAADIWRRFTARPPPPTPLSLKVRLHI